MSSCNAAELECLQARICTGEALEEAEAEAGAETAAEAMECAGQLFKWSEWWLLLLPFEEEEGVG